MDGIKVTSLFDDIPRMGHTNDLIQALISSSPSNNSDADYTTARDYAIGLTFIFFVVIIITVLWLLVVTILSCRFCRSTGFLSGRRFREHSRHATPIRIVFILSVFLWITATVLTYTNGIESLHGVLQTVENTNSEVSQLGTDGAAIVQNLTQLGVDAAELGDTLVEGLATNFCPAVAQDTLRKVTGIDFVAQKEEAVKALTGLSKFSREMNFVKIQDGLTKLQSSTERLDTMIEKVRTYTDEFVSLIILIPWIIAPTFLLIGVVLALFFVGSMKKVPCFWECSLGWIFLPVLVLQTVLSAVFASVLSILAVLNSDFCSPSTFSVSANSTLDGPQLTLVSVAESFYLSEIALLILKYYVSDCREVDPFNVNVQYQQEHLANTTQSLNQLSESIESVAVDIIQSICGDNAFQGFTNSTTEMGDVLKTLKGVVIQVLELLKCQNISPLIDDTLDDGVCYYCRHAVAWCVIGFSAIAFFGLVMITFRSSFRLSATDAILLEDDVNAMSIKNKNYNESDDDDDDDAIVVPNVEKKREEESPAQATTDDDGQTPITKTAETDYPNTTDDDGQTPTTKTAETDYPNTTDDDGQTSTTKTAETDYPNTTDDDGQTPTTKTAETDYPNTTDDDGQTSTTKTAETDYPNTTGDDGQTSATNTAETNYPNTVNL